jgi:Na+-driven multidrug efflux pump
MVDVKVEIVDVKVEIVDVKVESLEQSPKQEQCSTSLQQSFKLPRWKQELEVLLKLALPTMLLTGSQQGMLMTDLVFLGHIGAEELAAGALGNT